MRQPTIESTARRALSPWVTLVERAILPPGETMAQTFHSLAQADYVNVLAVTVDGRIPLVRQFRAAQERVTLELPGGLLDPGEAPAACALRELAEETGCVGGDAVALGAYCADTGRLENRMHGFFAGRVALPPAGWRAEPGVEPILASPAELAAAIVDGSFEHMMHVGIVGLAALRGLIALDLGGAGR